MIFRSFSFLQGSRPAPLRLVLGSIFCVATAGFAPARSAETVLYSFKGGSDGQTPLAGVVLDANGALFGTTQQGGGSTTGSGTVFMLTPPAAGKTQWTETVLHSFTGGTDGTLPYAGVILDAHGALYGATQQGGSVGGNGTVFKVTPPAAGKTQWTETVLYGFKGGTDGANPIAGLIFDAHGALYGTTRNGGSQALGTVFMLTPPAAGKTKWTESVLYSFKGGPTDGNAPQAGLNFDSNGALYGTTPVGGSSNFGTVFKLTPPAAGKTKWTETVLHSFTGGTDGANSFASVVLDANGAVYGTTQNGGTVGMTGFGTVFKLTPPTAGKTQWTETLLYIFKGESDGQGPLAGLIFDANGALYGTTQSGGINKGRLADGEVFKLTPPAAGKTQWTKTNLHSFVAPPDGVFCMYGNLIFDSKGALYDMTEMGGSSNFGTVYEVH